MASITPEIASFLERVRLSFVATVSPGGRPNVSPKGTLVRLDPGRLAFADIRSPDTVSNIARDGRVEISSIDPVLRRGYLFAGTALVRTEGEDFEAAVRIYQKMGVRSAIRAVVIVAVEDISEVTSPLYDLGAGEDEIRRAWTARYASS